MKILDKTYTSVVVMVCALAQTAIRAKQLRRAARMVVAMRNDVEPTAPRIYSVLIIFPAT